MKTILFVSFLLATGLFILQCDDNPTAGNGVETGNAVTAKILYPNGDPASGAKVIIRPRSFRDTNGVFAKILASSDTVTTNAQGVFTFDSLDSGTYVVEAVDNDSQAVRMDSVVVQNDDSLHDIGQDTLKPFGAIQGRLYLSEGGDMEKVIVLGLGFNRYWLPDSTGRFRLDSLAEGAYHLKFFSALDNYRNKDTVITVKAGVVLALDTVELAYSGIPTANNLRITYDTLKQIVILSWDKADTSLVKGYSIYRRDTDSSFGQTPINGMVLVRDTVYRDSMGIQNKSYEYKVVAIDNGDNAGKMSAGAITMIACAFPYLGTIGTSGTAANQYGIPTGVAIDDSGRILIADQDLGKILVYDTNGVPLHVYTGFDQPIYIMTSSNNSIYVTERGSQTIANVDSSGTVVFRFGGSGTGPGKFSNSSPFTFAIAANDDIYIPDYEQNRIEVFGATGMFKKHIITNGPWSILFIDSTKMAVGSDAAFSIMDTNGTILSQKDNLFAFILTKTRKDNLVAVTNIMEGRINVVKIIILSPDGNLVGLFGASDHNSRYFFGQVKGIAVDSANKLYLSDADLKEVKVFTIPSNL